MLVDPSQPLDTVRPGSVPWPKASRGGMAGGGDFEGVLELGRLLFLGGCPGFGCSEINYQLCSRTEVVACSTNLIYALRFGSAPSCVLTIKSSYNMDQDMLEFFGTRRSALGPGLRSTESVPTRDARQETLCRSQATGNTSSGSISDPKSSNQKPISAFFGQSSVKAAGGAQSLAPRHGFLDLHEARTGLDHGSSLSGGDAVQGEEGAGAHMATGPDASKNGLGEWTLPRAHQRAEPDLATQEKLKRAQDQGRRSEKVWRFQVWNRTLKRLEVDNSREPIPDDQMLGWIISRPSSSESSASSIPSSLASGAHESLQRQ